MRKLKNYLVEITYINVDGYDNFEIIEVIAKNGEQAKMLALQKINNMYELLKINVRELKLSYI